MKNKNSSVKISFIEASKEEGKEIKPLRRDAPTLPTIHCLTQVKVITFCGLNGFGLLT